MRGRRKRTSKRDGLGRRILVVELYHGGHHPQYLECLSTYWAARSFDSELHFVLSEGYRDQHPALLETMDGSPGVERHLVSASNLLTGRRFELLASDLRHGRTVAQWASKLGADRVLLMYLDHAQLSLAWNLRFDWPLEMSGILFRPTFHYRELGIAQSVSERIVAARKRLLLSAALRNTHLRHVFCSDHLAVERFLAAGSHVRAVELPEAVREDPPALGMHSTIAERVEPGRRSVLMLGNLDERKGIHQVLDALSNLNERYQSRLALVLAGHVAGCNRRALLERIDVFQRASNVQVVLEDRYLDEDELQPLVRTCDLVLLTYIGHVGSSGVLVRAARAGVPVLSTNVGLLGVRVRENRLGATLDATSESGIRATLEGWLEDPGTIPFDPVSARAFAAANTADAFAETIFSRLLEGGPRSPDH